uniref:Venom polypeptide n=1 Tax=Dolopus genitalis TaxID=2488630 RepID=A0A3G5BIJ1_DOLGE|nr:venom polypeptide [Dolopus genitalis]
MRFFVVILLAAVTAQTVLGKPGIIGDITSSIKDASKGIWDKIAEKAGAAIDKAIEKTKDMYKWALGEFAAMGDKLKDMEKKMIASGSDMLRSSFDAAKRFVNSSEEQIQDMLKIIDEKLELATKESVKIVLKETSDLKKWANRTLEGVNDPAKRAQAEKIVGKFVDKNLEKMNKCSQEATKPIKEVYEYANATAAEAAAVARKIVNMLEICYKATNIMTCAIELPQVIKDGNDLMITKFAPMKAKIAAIGTKGALKFSSCVATAKIAMEWEKASIENKINDL